MKNEPLREPPLRWKLQDGKCFYTGPYSIKWLKYFHVFKKNHFLQASSQVYFMENYNNFRDRERKLSLGRAQSEVFAPQACRFELHL